MMAKFLTFFLIFWFYKTVKNFILIYFDIIGWQQWKNAVESFLLENSTTSGREEKWFFFIIFINVLERQWMQLPCYFYWNAACPKGAWPDKPDAILMQKCRKFHHQFQSLLVPQHYTPSPQVFSMAPLP